LGLSGKAPQFQQSEISTMNIRGPAARKKPHAATASSIAFEMLSIKNFHLCEQSFTR
jgi:hypothetical protein